MRLIKLKTSRDTRGSLTAIESVDDIPFEIKRCYCVYKMSNERGCHAHRTTTQLVFSASGRVRIELETNKESGSFILDDPSDGLLIYPLTWINVIPESPSATLIVLANTHYDGLNVIRSYDEFLNIVKKNDNNLR